MGWRRVAAVVCVGVLWGAGTISSPSIGAERTSLRPKPGLLTWAGHVAMGATEQFPLKVALGERFWNHHPGSVQVTIRWPYDGGITDLGLTVRDGAGRELARSSGIDSNAESVQIPRLPDGDYVIDVDAASPTNIGRSTPGPIDYDGLAMIAWAPHGGAHRQLLPNLVPLKPSGFHLASAAYELPLPENTVTPCYPEETLQSPSHPTRCLRFDQTIANLGDGPLDLRFDVSGIASADASQRRMIQRLHRVDGSHVDRLADAYVFHAVHAHIHYQGFGQSKLFRYQWGKGRIGRGQPARVGNKVGFCVTEGQFQDRYWGAQGSGPREHFFPQCNVPSAQEDGRPYMVQGINVGWADLYTWNLADQYIDVTNLADGVYELQQIANPNHSVRETTASDNTASAIICLRATEVFEVKTAAAAASCVPKT